MTFEEWWRAYWYLPANYLGIKYEGVAKEAWETSHRQLLGQMNEAQLIAYLDRTYAKPVLVNVL